MSTVAVIGANGQLGSDVVEAFSARGHTVVPLTHADIEIEHADSVRAVLGGIKPDVVINTAAFHNVPKCEEDPGRAFSVNAVGPLTLARLSEDLKFQNIYISTDYVFDGAKRAPYVESDAPNPLNIYASSKLAGEYHTLNYSANGAVVRVSGIYGRIPCRAKGGNFITTMVKLAKEKPEVKVVDDEVLTPTPTVAIAGAIVSLVDARALGLFHLSCEGQCSWYEFARVIFETMHLTTPLLPTTVAAFPTPVKRPLYSVLENRRAKELALAPMPGWKDALVNFLKTVYGAA
jgi:dTDP-4-dehydrorhamnose reductase